MVNMSHHSYDRSTWHQVCLVVFLLANCFLNFSTYIFCLETELIGNEVDSLGIQTLVDRNHDTYTHKSSDNLVYTYVHHGSQLANGNKLGELQCLAFLALCLSLSIKLLLYSLALLLTIFSTLLILVLLLCKTSKCFLNLLCYIYLVYFKRLLWTVAVFLLLALVVIIVTIIILVATIVTTLVGSSRDIYTLLANTNALLALTILLSLLLTFAALLLLRLLLRTSALVKSIEVYLTQHIHLRSVEHLFLALELEHLATSILRSLIGRSNFLSLWLLSDRLFSLWLSRLIMLWLSLSSRLCRLMSLLSSCCRFFCLSCFRWFNFCSLMLSMSLCYRSLLFALVLLSLAYGSSFRLRCIILLCSTRLLGSRLTNRVKINLAQWFIFLLPCRSQQAFVVAILGF